MPAAAAAALPPEAGTPTGPVGTAGNDATPGAYDQVGYATWYGDDLAGQPTASGVPYTPDAATAAHRTLPLGSFAEVTSLETGRTILVQINDRGPTRADREIDLSRAAARALGIDARAIGGVRVRAVTPSSADTAALRQGQMAAPRLDTPEPVLRALRRQLPVASAAVPARGAAFTPGKPAAPRQSSRAGASYPQPTGNATPMPGYTPSAPLRPVSTPSPRPTPAPTAAPSARPAPTRAASAQSGFVVQVAAFSSADRARSVARSIKGSVVKGDGVWRVRLGPFRDLPAAQAARDTPIRRGYGDAAILMAP